jgi:hypothetical protein
MLVADAQKEVRTVFLGGFMGQTVSGLIWLASAALATWGTPREAILVLVVAGFFIFPLTQLGLRLVGRRGALRPENPLGALGMQVAFVLPLCLPLVGAATLHRLEWFYPAFMIVLGAHYLPFAFLYGMRMFLALSAILVGAGFALGWYRVGGFAAGAWITATVLFGFAVIGILTVRSQEGAEGGPARRAAEPPFGPSGNTGLDRTL